MIKFKQYITEVIHGPSGDIDLIFDPAPRLHEDMKKFENHYHQKIDKDGTKSLKNYTKMGYQPINHSLNHGKEKTIQHLLNVYAPEIKDRTHARRIFNRHISHVPKLDELTTSHEAPDDFYVYTGIKHDPSEGKEHKEPFKAHIKQFTSSSLDLPVTKMFSKASFGRDVHEYHHLKIKIPKNSKHGFYIGSISRHKAEKEFLLKRNLKLKIHHEPEIQRSDRGYHKIWHATIED